MIDFAKTLPFGDHTLDHRSPWQVGNHEDGYLVGIDNLIEVSDVHICIWVLTSLSTSDESSFVARKQQYTKELIST